MPMVIVFGSTSESCVMISGYLKGRPIDTLVTVTQKGRNLKVQKNYRFFLESGNHKIPINNQSLLLN